MAAFAQWICRCPALPAINGDRNELGRKNLWRILRLPDCELSRGPFGRAGGACSASIICAESNTGVRSRSSACPQAHSTIGHLRSRRQSAASSNDQACSHRGAISICIRRSSERKLLGRQIQFSGHARIDSSADNCVLSRCLFAVHIVGSKGNRLTGGWLRRRKCLRHSIFRRKQLHHAPAETDCARMRRSPNLNPHALEKRGAETGDTD